MAGKESRLSTGNARMPGKRFGLLVSLACVLLVWRSVASEPALPAIESVASTNGYPTVSWTPYPAAETYLIRSSADLRAGFSNEASGQIAGFAWTGSNAPSARFYRLEVGPMASNALLGSTVLNRLAYGPTPDDLEWVSSNGPQAYIDLQMAPETIQENMDSFAVTETVGTNEWVYATATGPGSSSLLLVSMSDEGGPYVDDMLLVAGAEPGVGSNLLQNGDFELALTNGWSVSSNMSASFLSAAVKRSGVQSLRVRADGTVHFRGGQWLRSNGH